MQLALWGTRGLKEVATYSDPLNFVLSTAQLINQWCGGLTTDFVAAHDFKDLSSFIFRSGVDLIILSLLLIQVVISLGDSSKISSKAHGNSAREEFSQATDDD
jgi:hypothetical protein